VLGKFKREGGKGRGTDMNPVQQEMIETETGILWVSGNVEELSWLVVFLIEPMSLQDR
jgi:hypothetical protein